MTVYIVEHWYDTDGGFGDAIAQEDVIAVFAHEEDAQRFIERYANPHVYDRPYAALECGRLVIRELEVLDEFDPDKVDTTKFWWMEKEEKETEDEEYSTVYEDEG